LIVAGAVLTIWSDKKVRIKIASGVLFLLGMMLYIQSALAFTFAFSTMALAMGTLYFLSMFESSTTRIFFIGTRIFLICMTLFTLWLELNRMLMPVWSPAAYRRLYVIGGALSSPSGIPSYVDILKSKYNLPAYNLSDPGNDVQRAMAQAEMISTGDVVVLVELGLHQDCRRFSDGLAPLLKRLNGNGRVVMMFEIPVLKEAGSYRKVQLDAAGRSGTVMIPRRVLARQIFSSHAVGNSLDVTGQESLADALAPMLQPLFSSPPKPLPKPLPE